MSILTSFLPRQNRPREYSISLIPHSDVSFSASMPDELVIDHQKRKERMSTIVRSKEGYVIVKVATLILTFYS
jgi:hypothetical protein